jgi:hypothetical protein
MFEDNFGICAPADAKWCELSDDLLQSPEAEVWRGLGERFRPFQRAPSEVMTETLREGIRRGNMDTKTRAIHNDELLGFYSVTKVMAQISNRSGAILEVVKALGLRSPKPGLLLSSIVRSEITHSGFGQVLLDDVLALALTDNEVKAIFVEPANERVAEMWRTDYYFEPVASSEVPGLLYFPLDMEAEESLA